MNLLVLSDLHFEHHADVGASFVDSLSVEHIDVVVLAGDITSASNIPDALGMFCKKFSHVLYVPGNHEYYGCYRESVRANVGLARRANDNLVVLDYQSGPVEIEGVRFLGGTLWFRESTVSKAYKAQMNDFVLIKEFESWVYNENRHTEEMLKRELRAGDVVVTHHLPSKESVDAEFDGHPLNPFFVCEIGDLIRSRKPQLHIHGHTHHSCDYQLGVTRIVCNPFGYIHALNPDFDERKIVGVQSSSEFSRSSAATCSS